MMGRHEVLLAEVAVMSCGILEVVLRAVEIVRERERDVAALGCQLRLDLLELVVLVDASLLPFIAIGFCLCELLLPSVDGVRSACCTHAEVGELARSVLEVVLGLKELLFAYGSCVANVCDFATHVVDLAFEKFLVLNLALKFLPTLVIPEAIVTAVVEESMKMVVPKLGVVSD